MRISKLSKQRAQTGHASCGGRSAACRRIGVHVAKPRARGRVAVEGSRSTRVSDMRIARRAVARQLRNCTGKLAGTTCRTTLRGTPSRLRYPL